MRKKAANGVLERAEGLSESLEDYLEVIFHLEQAHRVARAKDIAQRMNVRRASVTGALKALAGRGLIHYSPYRTVTLAAEGRAIAREIVRRHDTLREFFETTLRLDGALAEANACRMEHAIGPGAMDRLAHFLQFIQLCPRTSLEWSDGFARFCGQEGTRTASCSECLETCLRQVTCSPTDGKDEAAVGREGREP